MKAVVMAGGEGTRLRPMTANLPKPLLPVVNRPVMEHVLRLLRRHGFSETVVTVQFLAALVRGYFGDGEELGMRLSYATETTPLGTAGSVRNAADALRDDTFLVCSGDALTDFDLTALVGYHRRCGAAVTVALARVPNPLDFGMVVCDDDGRVARFLEKPTWGQVFTDTVNTGIYVVEPEILDRIPPDTPADWSADVLPRLLDDGLGVYGWVADGYWEDIGTQESYLRAHVDVLRGRVDLQVDGFEIAPGVWIGEGAEVDPEAVLTGPLCIGSYAKVAAGAHLGEYTVLGDNVLVNEGALLHRAVVHDNVVIGAQASLRGCVVGKSSDVLRAAAVEEGVVVGDHCVVEEEAILGNDVKIYPYKTIEAGSVVRQSVIWESRGQRPLFGRRGVSGLVNVEITPELCVRLAAAWATTMSKGSIVTLARDASRAGRALKRSVVGALTAAAIEVRDLETATMPVLRYDVRSSPACGGLLVRTTPGDPQSIDLVFLDEDGNDLSAGARGRLERVHSRGEFRRAFPGEIADVNYAPRTLEMYVSELLERIDTRGVREAKPRVVIDAAGGAAALVLPTLLGRLDVDVLTVNGRLDDRSVDDSVARRMTDLERLGELVVSSHAAFGVRFDPVGERVVLLDDRGSVIRSDRALLVALDLVAAENRGRRAALPVTTTRVAEQVCRFHGLDVQWTSTSPDDLTRAAADPAVVFAGDGADGYVVPGFAPALDGLAAFVRLLGLVARTRLTLSGIDARIPVSTVVRRSVPTPWAVKGAVMRQVLVAASDRAVDTTDGVKVRYPDGSWVLVLPDPAQARTSVWAEGRDAAGSAELLERWGRIVAGAAD